jgi:glycine cleavage system H protein
MSQTPSELKYASSHEWARLEEDGTVTVGITDHAQAALGDVVFVELPDVGATLAAGDDAGVVESVKAASDIYAPLGGEVIEVNAQLEDEPETVNSDPYNDGWFYKLHPADTSELDALLSAADYQQQCDDEDSNPDFPDGARRRSLLAPRCRPPVARWAPVGLFQ